VRISTFRSTPREDVSSALAALVGVVWLSLAGLAALYVVQRSPKRRKPVDELEATDQALKNRLIDLEDKFEHHLKRDANRIKREGVEQQPLPGIGPGGIRMLGRGGRPRGVV